MGGFGAICIGVVQSSNYQMGAFDQIRKKTGAFWGKQGHIGGETATFWAKSTLLQLILFTSLSAI
ncbi:conserved hypothetical protein [Microscilla marina ATCC 23134]|uniref:Uncharacterized protein n=1 Tax=Microscilla marina ATCC 23134 TaxID=313606 RepID=A1ZVF2_MICM2|nr:conserved hypothetical protein [Microscilla marina ATCC 23134]